MSERLNDMAVGDSGRVTGFDKGQKAWRKKLLSMGLTPGASFKVIRCAPMGDPVEIKVRGFSLSLRRAEAESVLIERQ